MGMLTITEENAWAWRYVNIFFYIAKQVIRHLQAKGTFGGDIATNGRIRSVYITPQLWAFDIWDAIYVLNGISMVWGPCFGGLQSKATEVAIWRDVYGYRFIALQSLTILWTILFVQEASDKATSIITFLTLLGMLFFATSIANRVRATVAEGNRKDAESRFDIISILILWLANGLWSGWLTAASIVSLQVNLKLVWDWHKVEWSVFSGVFALLAFLALATYRRDPLVALVGTWASIGVWDRCEHPSKYAFRTPMIQLDYDKVGRTFLIGAIILAVYAVLLTVYGFANGGLRGFFFAPPENDDAAESPRAVADASTGVASAV